MVFMVKNKPEINSQVFVLYTTSGMIIPTRTTSRNTTYNTFQTVGLFLTYLHASTATTAIIKAVTTPWMAETILRLMPTAESTIATR